ncbi:MAG: hypothetical protein ABIJ52_17245 [Pseudomonadota bacterium]
MNLAGSFFLKQVPEPDFAGSGFGSDAASYRDVLRSVHGGTVHPESTSAENFL